jgi:rod shape-determining protein MreD
MRTAAHVFLAYGLLLVVSVLWPALPFGRAAPDLLALCAVYLGLTARDQVAPAVVGAMITGYLADLLMGTPRGLLALDAGLVCLAGHFIHSRLLVRGWMFIAVFSFFTAVLSGGSVLVISAVAGLELRGLAAQFWVLAKSAMFTAVIGPPVFRLLRRVDARFARTQRERDAALEGLIP